MNKKIILICIIVLLTYILCVLNSNNSTNCTIDSFENIKQPNIVLEPVYDNIKNINTKENNIQNKEKLITNTKNKMNYITEKVGKNINESKLEITNLSNNLNNYETIHEDNNMVNILNPLSKLERDDVSKVINEYNENISNQDSINYMDGSDISSDYSDDNDIGPLMEEPSKYLDNNMNNSEGDDNNKDKTCKNETKCTLKTCSVENLHPILDPKFNMREAAKQCLLLEDHINNVKKRCLDCIRKHFLIVDGFLEEAVSLEKNLEKREYYRSLYIEWVKLEREYAKNPSSSNNLDTVSKKIRLFRKPLVEKYFDTVSEYDNL